MKTETNLVEKNLLSILSEVAAQSDVGMTFPKEMQSFDEQVDQVREYIIDAGEYSIAYEVLVSLLQQFEFKLSSSVAIKLLEVGLLFQFKTEMANDIIFDSRKNREVDA